MEAPVTRLLMFVMGLAVAGAVVGLMWSIYGGMSKSADFAVTNLQVFKSGNKWRVMFKVKNTGTVKIDSINVYLWRGTTQIASWSTGQDVGFGNEVFIDSGWVTDADPQYGGSLKCEIKVRDYGGTEVRKVFDVVVLQWHD